MSKQELLQSIKETHQEEEVVTTSSIAPTALIWMILLVSITGIAIILAL